MFLNTSLTITEYLLNASEYPVFSKILTMPELYLSCGGRELRCVHVGRH